jgi:6-phosphogluconolactonase
MLINDASIAGKIVYVGTFTTALRGGTARGLSVFRVSPESGDWQALQLIEAVNPSFLAFSPDRKHLYVSHSDTDYLSAYRIDPASGTLSFVNRVTVGDINPVHLAMHESGRYVVTATFVAGGITVLPINPDGSLAPYSDRAEVAGTPGKNKIQKGPQPHQIVFDPTGRFVLAPDRGVDTVHVRGFDAKHGKLVDLGHAPVQARSGAGPRHMDWHPKLPLAYVLNERDSSLAAYRWDGKLGTLTPLRVLPTLPETFFEDSTCAEIWVHPAGRFLYATNRGDDSLACFELDAQSGLPTYCGCTPTGGVRPRFFAFGPSGDFLYAANELGKPIVVFGVDPQTGKLTPTGRVIDTPTPTCILFL